MVKENLSRKLVSRCAIAVLAVAVTLTCYPGSSSSSDSAIAAQDEVSATETEYTSSTADTVALTMATFRASQSETTSMVSTQTQATTAGSTTVTSAASTTTASSKQADTTTTKSTTTTSANKTKSYIYGGYTTSASQTVTTTASSSAQTSESKQAGGDQKTSEGDLSKPVLTQEKTYDTDYTHPYNAQTNQIRVHWKSVAGAVKYMVFVKNGQYSDWTMVAQTTSTDYTVTGLRRDTMYSFAVKAVDSDSKTSPMSDAVNIKTARMDYSAAGWQAMCRIVFHEVGGAAGSFWDKPIVYVADCVANQYVCAKYTYKGSWAKYYSRYPNIESIIYTSGGFLSDAGLTARGATYQRVTERVKLAVWGATYGVTAYKNIENDYNVFYWCNSGSYKSSSKVAYNFKLPWGGYMQIWRQYWG